MCVWVKVITKWVNHKCENDYPEVCGGCFNESGVRDTSINIEYEKIIYHVFLQRFNCWIIIQLK